MTPVTRGARGQIWKQRVWMETFTGLRVTQFSGLLRVVRERGGNGTLRGRPWSLPLAERVLMVAVYYRTNLTMRQPGPEGSASTDRRDRAR